MPGRGNESRPRPSAPKSLITTRNGAPPCASIVRKHLAVDGEARRVRQHALVLREAAPAVGQVPVEQRVERIEEGLRMDQPALHATAVRRRRLVEPAHAESATAPSPGRPTERRSRAARQARGRGLAASAQRPDTPRRGRAPPAPAQSIQAERVGPGPPRLEQSLEQRSRSGTCWVSPKIHGDGTRRARPRPRGCVRSGPCPPIVASNSSGSTPREHSTIAAVADPEPQPANVAPEGARA